MRTLTRTAGAVAWPVTRLGVRATRTPALTLLGWHRLGDADDGLTTSYDDFRRHLDVLEEWGATVLPLTEATQLLSLGELPERAVVLTFDDGYASVLEQAWPELRSRDLPATLFAVSGYLAAGARFPWDHAHGDAGLTRLATAAELRAVAEDGMDIGSHTVSHRWLPNLSAVEVAEEMHASRCALEDLLDRPIRTVAYPMGGYSGDIRDLAEAAGYEVGITCDRGRNTARHDTLALRRAFAFDRADDVRRQLDGAYTWMRPIEDRRYRREPRW